MSSHTPVKVVLGCGTIGGRSDPIVKGDMYTAEGAQAFFSLFRKYGHTELDTARGYSPNEPGTCEPIMGQTDINAWAQTSSKIAPWPDLKSEHVLTSVQETLTALKTSKVYIEYLHATDPKTPVVETCKAINEAHKAGAFEKFGLSNASPDEIDEYITVCEQNGWIKPSVYQGAYNAIARLPEDKLLPTLRKHGIQFYAYSPAAGGMFSGGKTTDSKIQARRGNYDGMASNLHKAFYHKEALIEACSQVTEAATRSGTTGHAVALRWALHHSALSGEHGDAIIIGASSVGQLDETLKACAAGPLPDHLLKLVEEVWELARPVAPPAWLLFADYVDL